MYILAAAGGGKKRAPWDLKGRLQDMEAMMAQHMNSMNANKDRISQLESLNNQLEGTVAQKEEQTSVASQEIDDLRKRLR